MREFSTVSVSSTDPAALAAQLTERSAEGWSVDSIVASGAQLIAVVSREAGAAPATTAPAATEAAAPQATPAAATPAPAAAAPQPTPAAASPTPAAAAPAAAAPAATPAVPAGWYADPAGRFELRYWDGAQWTEHVSRAGQQYTDPPVA